MDSKEFDRSFRYRKITQSIPFLMDGIHTGRIKFDPAFAYSKSWPNLYKSAFIESILVGMPTTDILCEENYYGELFVLDGIQRILTLDEFFNNGFKLQGLKLIPSLEGYTYSQLSYGQSSVFYNRAELNLTIISYDTDAILKFEFFKRVHSDSYRFPMQLARNYAFREQCNFIRNLQYSASDYLISSAQYSPDFPTETSKLNHRKVSDYDELYLSLCSASLIYHHYMPPPLIRASYRMSDLLDDSAIFLHHNPYFFDALSNVIISTLSEVKFEIGGKILVTDISIEPKVTNDGHVNLDRDRIVLCFINKLKKQNINFDEIKYRSHSSRNLRSVRWFYNEILN